MKPDRRHASALLLTLAMLGCGTSRAAAGITLDKLVAGGTLESDGLVFSQFKYQVTGPDMATADKITVSAIVLNGQPGLQFEGVWSDGPNNPGVVAMARIEYLVTVKDPGAVNGALLLANPSVTPTRAGTDGYIQVQEKFALNCPG